MDSCLAISKPMPRLEPVTRAICCFISLSESYLIIILLKILNKLASELLWLEKLDPSGLAMISLQKADSLLDFLSVTVS